MYFDIGANIGLWALANVDTCTKVIAVEASPITFERLKGNCKHDKVTLLNFAACNNDGKDIVFYHSHADTISTINKDWLTSEKSRFCNYTGYQQIVCKTITLDKLIEMYGVPDLIKIDVENGEYECITSLTQKVPCLCFEWSSEFNDITFKCMDYLSTVGFTRFYLQFSDAYTFRPKDEEYSDMASIKEKLSKTTPKKEMGMIWCK